jgi:hypothetical protein
VLHARTGRDPQVVGLARDGMRQGGHVSRFAGRRAARSFPPRV